MVSPRTRNLLRAKAKSLRSYCSSTRRPRIARWSRSSPTSRIRRLLRRTPSGRAEPVDRRHRGDDDHVAPRHQRAGGRVAQPVDLVVDRRVLLDVGVGGRQVRLGLVVVVVGDEVLDPVLREQLAELAGELRGEALVGREHERRPVDLGDDAGGGEALARAGDAEQRLELVAPLDPAASAAIASGWSPAGERSETSFERRHANDC